MPGLSRYVRKNYGAPMGWFAKFIENNARKTVPVNSLEHVFAVQSHALVPNRSSRKPCLGVHLTFVNDILDRIGINVFFGQRTIVHCRQFVRIHLAESGRRGQLGVSCLRVDWRQELAAARPLRACLHVLHEGGSQWSRTLRCGRGSEAFCKVLKRFSPYYSTQ